MATSRWRDGTWSSGAGGGGPTMRQFWGEEEKFWGYDVLGVDAIAIGDLPPAATDTKRAREAGKGLFQRTLKWRFPHLSKT